MRKSIVAVSVVILMIAVAGIFFLKTTSTTSPADSSGKIKILYRPIGQKELMVHFPESIYRKANPEAKLFQQINGAWQPVGLLPASSAYVVANDSFTKGHYNNCDAAKDRSKCCYDGASWSLELKKFTYLGKIKKSWEDGSALKEYDNYQSTPVSGKLKVEVEYFNDKHCQNAQTFTEEFQAEDQVTEKPRAVFSDLPYYGFSPNKASLDVSNGPNCGFDFFKLDQKFETPEDLKSFLASDYKYFGSTNSAYLFQSADIAKRLGGITETRNGARKIYHIKYQWAPGCPADLEVSDDGYLINYGCCGI